jgi:urea transporter
MLTSVLFSSPLFLHAYTYDFVISHWTVFCACFAFNKQNPDTPAEKPKLQSYKVDLSQCGPMMLDALVRGF